MGLSNSEILAVCKILLESRSMRRDEMLPILDKLVDCCVPEENKRAVQQMIGNEKLHYIEPHHGQPVLRGVDRKQSFENPEDLYPTIYRIDRICAFRATGEHFTPAYARRFQEGEFRRRVQFMYGGRLQKSRFRYTGPSIEAVLDRLPTAEILS